MNFKEAAQTALQLDNVQDIQVVVMEFKIALRAIEAEAQTLGYGKGWINHHAITRLFAARVLELSGTITTTHLLDAYRTCKEIANA